MFPTSSKIPSRYKRPALSDITGNLLAFSAVKAVKDPTLIRDAAGNAPVSVAVFKDSHTSTRFVVLWDEVEKIVGYSTKGQASIGQPKTHQCQLYLWAGETEMTYDASYVALNSRGQPATLKAEGVTWAELDRIKDLPGFVRWSRITEH